MNAKETLKVYFGYDSFREGQESIINTIMSGRDALAIMPTGAGKSICYQIPALMLPGITIVISPLISLMQDQVKALNEAGIHAAYINSSLTEEQISRVFDLASKGKYKIMYVAPERLENWEFAQFADTADISMVTVDEAHCISQWGQDFRPSYLNIANFVNRLSTRPIVSAFTATATEEVKKDIICILKLNTPNITVTGFDRENLYYSVEMPKSKADYVRNYVAKHLTESGIIYCATRKNVDRVYEMLISNNVAATKYHAGISNIEREKNQNDFIYDRAIVIVATNAFGMGIDKSNVRYVLHYNMPQSMENYYQEAGRAGRDGEPAQCVLLFSTQDIMINKLLLERKDFSSISPENIPLIMQHDIKRLREMENYCRTTSCLRNFILEYFGEKTSTPCNNCGNCHRQYQIVDMTYQAKWIINCIAEAHGRYGVNIILGTLLGANRARIKEVGANNYKSYGKLKDTNEKTLKTLVYQMITEGYIYQSVDQYSVLKIGNIESLRNENTRVMIKLYEEKDSGNDKKISKKKITDSLTRAGYELFEKLRELRFEIAKEEAIPPYIVFSDKTLIDMCVKLPQNGLEMLNVNGVGNTKNEKYGRRFLDAIELYQGEHPDTVYAIGGIQEEKEVIPAKKEKKKNRKAEFFLERDEALNFSYQDLYYLTEIKEELNRIRCEKKVKRITGVQIWDYLRQEKLVEEKQINGRYEKVPTLRGIEMGIISTERVSKAGNAYTVLMYPSNVQRFIVEHYVIGEKNDNLVDKDNEAVTDDSGEKKKYAEWVKEYSETVVVRKEGFFYTVRGEGAVIVGQISNYDVSDSSNPITGTPVLEQLTELLKEKRINYAVIVDNQIVEKNLYEDNKYKEYL